MPLPKFTDEERYLINYVKSFDRSVGHASSYMWGYLSGAAIVAGFAVYYDNVWMVLCAFAIVCAFRINEERHQHRYTAVWRDIIAKFEEASAGVEAGDDER